mmetsp:Transcript_8213/g.26244  ORF Transcript_8213/g.26244 Transcript_8213/m.26244 type:complete len:265 (-) Transcript_8213:1253-2047(-)
MFARVLFKTIRSDKILHKLRSLLGNLKRLLRVALRPQKFLVQIRHVLVQRNVMHPRGYVIVKRITHHRFVMEQNTRHGQESKRRLPRRPAAASDIDQIFILFKLTGVPHVSARKEWDSIVDAILSRRSRITVAKFDVVVVRIFVRNDRRSQSRRHAVSHVRIRATSVIQDVLLNSIDIFVAQSRDSHVSVGIQRPNFRVRFQVVPIRASPDGFVQQLIECFSLRALRIVILKIQPRARAHRLLRVRILRGKPIALRFHRIVRVR